MSEINAIKIGKAPKNDPMPSIWTELVYTMPSKNYEAGELLIRPGEPSETVMLIEHGVVEVYIFLSGNKFVIERLFSGSIINYRNVLLEDEPGQVYVQCLRPCFILELTEAHLNTVLSRPRPGMTDPLNAL